MYISLVLLLVTRIPKEDADCLQNFPFLTHMLNPRECPPMPLSQSTQDYGGTGPRYFTPLGHTSPIGLFLFILYMPCILQLKILCYKVLLVVEILKWISKSMIKYF